MSLGKLIEISSCESLCNLINDDNNGKDLGEDSREVALQNPILNKHIINCPKISA